MSRKQKASFGLVKAALFYTGVTPNKPGEVPTIFNRIRRAIPLLAAAYNFYCVIILIVSIYQKQDDLGKALLYFGNICFRIQIFFKFGGLYRQEGKVTAVIQEIEILFNDLVREDDVKIQRVLRIMRGIEKFAALFWLLSNSLLWLQVPGMFAKRSLFTFNYHPYDITKSPMCEITIVTEVVSTLLGFGSIIIADCTFVVVLVHLIAIARSLGLALEFNSVWKIVVLIQLFVTFLAGLSILYVQTATTQFETRVFFILFITFGLYVELLVMCLLADVLSDYSLQVGEAAYSCDWLNASARFKHALRMIISRSQRELCVKAAGVPLSRRTFRTITRAGYYLQMMLSNFYNGVKIVGQTQ